MPRLPVHQHGVHSLDYPYQGSRAPTWASHTIMSDEGADFLRIPAPGTHAVPAFVSPNLFCCAHSRVGHNLVAFAQQEGYEPHVLGVLPFDSSQWPLTGFIPKGTSDARRVVSDRDFAAALLYMAEVRERWEPLMGALGILFPTKEPYDEVGLAACSRHRLVRVVQAQFQQIAFTKQLTDALVHDSAQMGDAADAWLAPLADLPQALAAYVTLVPPRWVCAPKEAALGCVPAARVMVEYVRFRLSRRHADPTGLPVYLSTPITSLRQLTLFLSLDLPRVFPRLSADVYADYGILSGVVARWSLALGVEMFLPPPTREVGVRG